MWVHGRECNAVQVNRQWQSELQVAPSHLPQGWELNSGPWKELQVPFPADTPLQPNALAFGFLVFAFFEMQEGMIPGESQHEVK